jgi:hypothetical protein
VGLLALDVIMVFLRILDKSEEMAIIESLSGELGMSMLWVRVLSLSWTDFLALEMKEVSLSEFLLLAEEMALSYDIFLR